MEIIEDREALVLVEGAWSTHTPERLKDPIRSQQRESKRPHQVTAKGEQKTPPGHSKGRAKDLNRSQQKKSNKPH